MDSYKDANSSADAAHRDTPRSATYSRVLDVPEEMRGRTETFYSSESDLIVLQAQRGPLLARYLHPQPPDRSRHVFFATFPEDYVVFEGASVPAQAPADVEACAWPVQREANPVSTVAAGNPGSPSSSTSPDERDVMFTPQSTKSLLDQEGIRTGPGGTHVHGGGGGGLSVDSEGVHVTGGFEQPSPEKRGVMQQSPAFGIVPKSFFTFPAADYIPDMKRVQEMVNIVQTVRQGVSWISAIASVLR